MKTTRKGEHENKGVLNDWKSAVRQAEGDYMCMLKNGCSPQIARFFLPNCLKTEIAATANFREWRHFFRLRCAKTAHPQMRQIACLARELLYAQAPSVFEDLMQIGA